MITILKIGHHTFALKPGTNPAALLKALSEAVQVRHCYSAEKPFRYRALHEDSEQRHKAEIEVLMVDSRAVGPADPTRDDYGEEIARPARRGLQITNG